MLYITNTKKKAKGWLSLLGDCVGATVEHVWDNRTDYLLLYTLVMLLAVEHGLNKRFDRLEQGSIHVALGVEDIEQISTWKRD